MLGNVSVRQVLHDCTLGNDIRILYIAPDESYVYWIELAKDGGMPRKESMTDLETRMLTGDLVKANDTWLPPTDDSNENSRKHREECWKLLGTALMNEPAIYEKSARVGILQPIAEENGRLLGNLYPMLKRYWRYGKVKNAFLPADERKGGKGRTRRLRKNSGPAPGEKATCSKILTETDIALFEKYYHAYYLKGSGNSLLDVYDKMIREEYADKTDDGSGVEQIVSHGHGAAPTFRQFQYWHLKNRDRNLETVEREGESAMNLRERATTGKADFGMRGPGAQYQIDATIADVYLVSRFNRSNIIGRPIVYFVKDAFSSIFYLWLDK